jgi:hypothetical protein
MMTIYLTTNARKNFMYEYFLTAIAVVVNLVCAVFPVTSTPEESRHSLVKLTASQTVD